MERIAIYVDDAGHARNLLEPLMDADKPGQWFVVMCPPRLTRRIGRWLSNQQRQQWRSTWSQKLRDELAPVFAACPGSQVHWQLANGALTELTDRLRRRHGSALRVLDARRPRLGHANEPLSTTETQEGGSRWTAPVAVGSSMSLMLTLVD